MAKLSKKILITRHKPVLLKFQLFTWLSNSTAQAMALARVKPEVLETMPESLSHFSLVTCLATKLWVDLMVGKSAILLKKQNDNRLNLIELNIFTRVNSKWQNMCKADYMASKNVILIKDLFDFSDLLTKI